MSPVPKKRFYSIKEVCSIASISRSTVIRAEKSGTCPPGRRFGTRCIRFDKSQIDQWLATGSWSSLQWQQQEGDHE